MPDTVKWMRTFRKAGTRKRSTCFYDVLPDELTLDPQFSLQTFDLGPRRLFREVVYDPWDKYLNEGTQRLLKLKAATVQETPTEFAWRFVDTYEQSLLSEWDPKKVHVHLHSSGMDSRLFSWLVKRLWYRMGDEWLGKILFVSAEWEMAGFTKIMDHLDWPAENRYYYRPDVPLRDYWEESLDFPNVWANHNGPRSYPWNCVYFAHPRVLGRCTNLLYCRGALLVGRKLVGRE